MTECSHCGYEWEYGGDMKKATCPSCQSKTLVAPDSDTDD